MDEEIRKDWVEVWQGESMPYVRDDGTVGHYRMGSSFSYYRPRTPADGDRVRVDEADPIPAECPEVNTPGSIGELSGDLFTRPIEIRVAEYIRQSPS